VRLNRRSRAARADATRRPVRRDRAPGVELGAVSSAATGRGAGKRTAVRRTGAPAARAPSWSGQRRRSRPCAGSRRGARLA
jgi:hypothetical protein